MYLCAIPRTAVHSNLSTVFGWFQNSFNGVEQDSAYSLSVGYLKGAEQAGVSSILNLNVMIMTTPGNASNFDCVYMC